MHSIYRVGQKWDNFRPTAAIVQDKVCGCWCCSDTFEYLEEFPLNLLHELPERTGHSVTDRGLIVIVLEYGANFSGPGEDVFRETRAIGDAKFADFSNFLHPVFYHYNTLPTGCLLYTSDAADE